ncbi:MAG: hypothetical protein AAF433_01805 [Bacteroidota bacterium]
MTDRQSTTLTVIGFLLFLLGFFSLALNLVGVDLAFLRWVSALGQLPSFLIRMAMVIVGMVFIFVGQTDWKREEL